MNDKDLNYLAAIVRDSDDAIIGKTVDGIITSWNRGAERIYGYTYEEAIGRTIAMLVPADRQDEVPKILQNITLGAGVHHYDTLRVTKDGRLVNISLTISPIRDLTGAIIGISSIGRDVTKEKEAEAALRESARAYKLLMEQASDAILVSYPDQPLIEVNQRASDMFGYTGEELLQLRGEHNALPEGLSALLLRPEEIPQNNVVYVERLVRRKDGTVIVTELSTRRLDDGRIVTIARDVTDRKRAEQALGESEARYRAIVEDQTMLVSRFYPDGTLTFVNEASCRFWKRTREQLLGQSFFQYLPDDERARLQNYLSSFTPDNALQTTEQMVISPAEDSLDTQPDLHNSLPGSGVNWWQLTLRALFDENGILQEFQQVGVDITDRKLAEKTLKENEVQLSQAQEIAHIGSWEYNLITQVSNWSDELYRIFGVEPQSHPASIDAYIAYAYSDDRAWLRAELERGFVEGIPFDYDHRVVRPDGSIRIIYTQGEVIPDDSGKPYKIVGIVQDITEHRLAEGARTAREAAEQANQAKSEFLSRMSHELRTPLNAILGFGQLLQMDKITPEQQESVGYILKAGGHLLKLINEVLEISRIEEGKTSISIEPVSVHDVMQESLDLVRLLASHRDISLNIDLDAPNSALDSCFVMADRQMLQQVLLNLFANAIKYNHLGGSVTVSCTTLNHEREVAEQFSPDNPQKVRIAISDTGPGLSPAQIARLFTPFERLGAEQTEVEGTGLGLALSKHMVRAMGGIIGVESHPGVGSTFWLELATADEHMPALEMLVTGPLFEIQVDEQPHTILYIEDNLSNLRLIERIVKKQPGITLITAMQGQLGLDMAYEHCPDLILLDLHLPDMTGNEVLRRLHVDHRTSSIPVVVLSADANPVQIEKLLQAGAQAYLTKPLNVVQLLNVLAEIPGRGHA